MVMGCLRLSGSRRSSGNQRTIGVSSAGISRRSIAMPTSVEMMLLEADLMLAKPPARWPGAWSSNASRPRWLITRPCNCGSAAATALADEKSCDALEWRTAIAATHAQMNGALFMPAW